MQSANTIEIRRVGLSKINRITRAARHLDVLRTAFNDWQAGEIYVCKKTGTYRYRHGEKSKSVAPWSGTALAVFDSPAAFALAALVFEQPAPVVETQPPVVVEAPAPSTGRANIIQLAEVAA